MNYSVIYQTELLRIQLWSKFILKTATKIGRKYYNVPNINNIIKNSIIKYNTLIIGMYDITFDIFFNYEKIKQIKNSIYNDLNYLNFNNTDSEFIFTTIYNKMKKYNNIFYENVKNINDTEITITTKITTNDIKILVIFDNNNKIHIYRINKTEYYKLKNLYMANDKISTSKSEYDLNFWICNLLLRYKFFNNIKCGISLSANSVYSFFKLKKLDGIVLECFAGSINSNLQNYCSLFYDIEKNFGSFGSFFKIPSCSTKFNILISNPPFMIEIMELASLKILDYLEKCSNNVMSDCSIIPQRSVTAIICMPDWRSKNEYNDDLNLGIQKVSKLINTTDRSDTPYNPYIILRRSKYLKKIYVLGDYAFHSFWENKNYRMSNKYNVLFLILTNFNINSNQLPNYNMDNPSVYNTNYPLAYNMNCPLGHNTNYSPFSSIEEETMIDSYNYNDFINEFEKIILA
jgi:hypothetical protein